MKCINPFVTGTQAYGCGQCLPCRIQKRRIWKTRIILEAMQSSNNSFVTLTYSDDRLPMSSLKTSAVPLPTLEPRDLQLFLKRLRFHCPQRLRFFAVGEYGNKTWRPHYHVGLFNFLECARGETKKSLVSRRCLWNECCDVCRMVGNTWGHGDIEVRALDGPKCEYLARYVTKKMTTKEDARLLGRHPEFSRQSRRPGIGASSVAEMAQVITRYFDASELVDVPMHVNQGKNKPLLLGRYLRKKLRAELKLPEETPDHVLREAWYEQMLPLLKMAQEDETAPSLGEQIRKANAPYEASLQMKQALYEKGGKL